MNITKRDVLELRRRLKKESCNFGRLCGCYVGGDRQVLLQFNVEFSQLEDDDLFKYLEIAKKAMSGTPGGNLLELEFAPGEAGDARRQSLLALRSSRFHDEEMLDGFYQEIMERYVSSGNYLILLFHDIYDVIVRGSDRRKLDESEETYEYMICAVCPVELSKAALGYREEEHRIGARIRDWVVGMPDIAFTYPAFIDRSTDVNAVMYYVRPGRSSHPEFIEQVLGCLSQRTAGEEKSTFQSVVQGAFGEEKKQAEAAFYRIQQGISGMVEENEQYDDAPPVSVTADDLKELMVDAQVPPEVRDNIQAAFQREFGDGLPTARNVLDQKLLDQGAQRQRTLELEQEVHTLRQQLEGQEPKPAETAESADDQQPTDLPWEDSPAVTMTVAPACAEQVRTQIIGGKRFLLVPLEQEETCVCINGISKNM